MSNFQHSTSYHYHCTRSLRQASSKPSTSSTRLPLSLYRSSTRLPVKYRCYGSISPSTWSHSTYVYARCSDCQLRSRPCRSPCSSPCASLSHSPSPLCTSAIISARGTSVALSVSLWAPSSTLACCRRQILAGKRRWSNKFCLCFLETKVCWSFRGNQFFTQSFSLHLFLRASLFFWFSNSVTILNTIMKNESFAKCYRC